MSLRSSTAGELCGLAKEFSENQSLEVFRRMCDIRYFESNIVKAHDENLARFPVFYLAMGQESTPAALSVSLEEMNFKQFAQHRSHGYYLAFGGNPEELIDELLSKPTGCAGGMGGSASIHSPRTGMIGHDGLMGSNIPIGIGYALGKNFELPKEEIENVLIVAGDAAWEEGYAQGALALAATHKPNTLCICEDNDYSVMTKIGLRRNWEMTNVAKAYGIPNAENITDNPWLIMYWANKMKGNLPGFLNIYTSRLLWHNWTKPNEVIGWDRLELTKSTLNEMGLGGKIKEIEGNSKQKMNRLWRKKLKETNYE